MKKKPVDWLEKLVENYKLPIFNAKKPKKILTEEQLRIIKNEKSK